MAICAPCPAICPMTTRGWAGWMDFTRRGWLNPDFELEFRNPRGIRPVSRWCLVGVSGLKGFVTRSPPIKVRRVGRSTQTDFDADRGPLCAQPGGACERGDGGAVAAMARPCRSPDHRAA